MSDIPPELLAEITPALRAFVESLLIQMAEMQAKIDESKAQVKRPTPKNSWVPPSTQHPQARPAAKPKSKTKKPRGGQKGHKQTIRDLVPVEQCTEVIPLHPKQHSIPPPLTYQRTEKNAAAFASSGLASMHTAEARIPT